jgi:hypothetical protein
VNEEALGYWGVLCQKKRSFKYDFKVKFKSNPETGLLGLEGSRMLRLPDF